MLLLPSLYITGSGIQVQSLQMLLPTDGFGSDSKPFYMALAWLLLQGWSAIFLGTPEEKAINSAFRPAYLVDSKSSSTHELVNPEDVIHWHICTCSYLKLTMAKWTTNAAVSITSKQHIRLVMSRNHWISNIWFIMYTVPSIQKKIPYSISIS